MIIPTPPSHKTFAQFKLAEDSILIGKFLSYIPSDGWAYRTMDEIKGSKEDAEI